MAGRLYSVSPHVLMETRKCSLRGLGRHVLGYTSIGDSIKMKAGSAFHAGMETYLKPAVGFVATAEQPLAPIASYENRQLALAALHAVYDSVWAATPADKLDAAYTPDNIHRLFDRWMELHPWSQLTFTKVLAVETAFVSRQWKVKGEGSDVELVEIPMSIGEVESGLYDVVRLICRPDAIVETADGIAAFLDTKTTGWHVTDQGWARALRMSLQAKLYADAVVQMYPNAHYKGWINACEIKKLPESDRKCGTHKGMTYAECGSEHTKTVMLDCTANAETVAKAVLEAKRAATQFVKLSRWHEAHIGASAEVETMTPESYPIQDIPIEGASTDQCRFCPAADWCDSGAVVAALPNFMAYDPWPVETGQRNG